MSRKLFFFISFILVIGLAARTANAALVAHWEFNEGAGSTAYDSANGYNGTIYGATWTTGIIGGALSFDGSGDCVDCSSPFASITSSTTKTIAAWAKSYVTDYPDDPPGIGGQYGGRILTLYRGDGVSAFSIYGVGDPATWEGLYYKLATNYQFFNSGVSVTANKWTHIALVQDGPDIIIYINGIPENSASNASVPYLVDLVNATIGAYLYQPPASCSYFNGVIDDVRIYNHALTQSEIQQLIPEPATMLLLGLGGLFLSHRK